MVLPLLGFAAATGVVLLVGPLIARMAEALAQRTGLGQALFGAIFLGASTSLPGIVFTISATAGGRPAMALSSALGGIVAQTAFIAAADVAFRRGILTVRMPTDEVAVQSAALMVLLSLVLVGVGSPGAVLAGVHVSTPLLAGGYVLALVASRHLGGAEDLDVGPQMGGEGGLSGVRGKKGAVDTEPIAPSVSTRGLWLRFAGSAALLAAAGAALEATAGAIVDRTGLSEAAVGGAFTAFATSTPELVTAVAAARRGAIGLAAGDIIGGNAFDILFIAAADLVPGVGSIYALIGPPQLLLLGAALGLNGVLLEGLIRRGRQGVAWVGWESVVVVLGYVAVLVALLMA